MSSGHRTQIFMDKTSIIFAEVTFFMSYQTVFQILYFSGNLLNAYSKLEVIESYPIEAM
jgi:hypothetical protein